MLAAGALEGGRWRALPAACTPTPRRCGHAQTDMDKKGERCVTVDCILNTDVLTQAKAFRPLKVRALGKPG
eukprot:365852-Chlamydomonas_euryale.AAC.9